MAFVSSKSEERSTIVEKFREKELSILVTTTILERGVTFPQVDVLFAWQIITYTLVRVLFRLGVELEDPQIDRQESFYFFHEGLSKSMLRCREEIKVMNKKGGFNNEVSTM